jgi:PilZ domain-containing protein
MDQTLTAQEEDDRGMIHPDNNQERRRSQRIPHSMPLFVKEVDAPFVHGGNARTIEVSRHGCVIHALRPYPCGTELHLDALYGNRTTTARVVHSDPIGTGMHFTTWTIALELSKPGNFWLIESLLPDCPQAAEQ